MQKGSTHEEFALKQTAPKIVGSGVMIGGDKVTVAYDLVEQMEYLYVRVVKAKELTKDVTGSFDPYVEVKVGNYKGITKHFEKKTNPEWNYVFAFSQDRLQASYIEVCVKDKDVVLDEMIGRFVFDLVDIPRRVPPDSSLTPQWIKEAKTEPFEEPLVITVEDKVGSNFEFLGKCVLPLSIVPRRLDNKPVPSKWHNLEKHTVVEGEKKETKFASKIHLRLSLDGGYHVLDESVHYSSDFKPTSKLLWKSSIGLLELGIISATGLSAMKSKDGQGTTDAYCVAKYGPKWVRTRTIIDSFSPKWNEQYTWEVHDPCTMITVGVFDNGYLQGGKCTSIGKVRIRLSTLETEKVYTHSYPLIVLQPSGVKKMGEVFVYILCQYAV
ncbi:Protein QUIRKY [Capsicum chinense]|nr:Protein QUIRKY [Capsicum chinense]